MRKDRRPLTIAIVTLLMVLASGISAIGQQPKRNLFVGVFKATNPEFFVKGPRPEDVPVLKEHVEYWQNLTERGISIVGGHTLNRDESAFGLVVVSIDSEAAAREIIERSPLVRAGLAKVTVYPFEGLVVKPLAFKDSSSMSQPANSESKESRSADLKTLAVAYVTAVGEKQFDRLAAMLSPDVEFTTPGRPAIRGAQDYVAALRRLTPILARNDIKRVFVDGNEVCVVYDFVTDTSVGPVPSVEWLTFEDGRIRSSRLIFHTQPWPEVLKELIRRTKPTGND